MANSIQVLQHDLPLNKEQTVLMDIVLRESQRLNDIIRNFLAYARPQQPVPTRMDLNRLLNETAHLLRNNPNQHPDHEIALQLDKNTLTYNDDETQLRQVMWNLAVNGLRAIKNSGTLTLTTTPTNAQIILEVQNTDYSMTAEQHKRLFQPFQSDFAQKTELELALTTIS